MVYYDEHEEFRKEDGEDEEEQKEQEQKSIKVDYKTLIK